MAENRQKDIFLSLKKQGFEVYFPGQHVGDCLTKYVVVKQGVTSKLPGFSTMVRYFNILCYVPKDFAPSLMDFVQEVQNAMLDLSPMIKFNDTMQEPYFDDSVNGWLMSIEYINYYKQYSDLFQKINLKKE